MLAKLDNIKVHYPGVKALDGVTLDIREHEVHGIIGENGAGKSTLMNVLSGSIRPTAGTISMAGVPVVFDKPASAVARGISLVSQEGSLVPNLSAAANICLGAEVTRFGFIINNYVLKKTAEKILERWFPDVQIALDASVNSLPYASQRIIEILRALHSKPRILILDEPTATLPAREKEHLWELIRNVSRNGVAVVLISHFMTEILHLSDHVTALQDGKVVRSVSRDGLTERDLVAMMFNRQGGFKKSERDQLSVQYAKASGSEGAVLSVSNWQGSNFSVDNFEARSGEIVGLIGLTGSGHTEFASSIYQPRLAERGSLYINNKKCNGFGARQMRKNGVAYIPDHRMINAIIGHWTVRENLSLINIENVTVSLLGYVRADSERREADLIARKLNVKMTSVEQKLSELSGGNKQKVSIGRWLCLGYEPVAVFIFIEPTEGVDIGSKQEIHQLMRQLANNRSVVIMASSDLLEVAAVADRVLPFVRGRNGPEILQQDFSEKIFIDAIVGAV